MSVVALRPATTSVRAEVLGCDTCAPGRYCRIQSWKAALSRTLTLTVRMACWAAAVCRAGASLAEAWLRWAGCAKSILGAIGSTRASHRQLVGNLLSNATTLAGTS